MTLFDADSEYADQTFNGVMAHRAEVAHIAFYDCHFLNCDFREAVFASCRFMGCTFESCDLSMATVAGTLFQETEFIETVLVGVNWAVAKWSKWATGALVFRKCTLNYGTFIGVNLRKATLVDCVARDVDFSEADMTEANCGGTNFSESRFWQTNLTKTNFEDATNYAIDVKLNTLKETRFALPEAVSLLHGLDIILRG